MPDYMNQVARQQMSASSRFCTSWSHSTKMAAARNLRLALLAIILQRRARRRRKEAAKRRFWVRPWLSRRPMFGAYEQLMTELAEEDLPGYRSFQRLYPDLFAQLLAKVAPIITKQDTKMRQAIPAGVRLALTLRYLATGHTYLNTSFEFRVAPNTIGRIIPETCDAIYAVLSNDYFKCPSTPEEWLEVSEGFKQRWNFPNCLGAIDGKHVNLRQPGNTGSLYFNYKHFFSVVLMAVVDSDYKFLYANCGVQGRISDGGVWGATKLCRALQTDKMNLPADQPLPGDFEDIPFSFVGDEAFPLRQYLLKPYPQQHLTREQRLFNYRLSRARRVVEKAFGMLANRFRVFLGPMLISPEKVQKVVMAALCLHNMLRVKYGVPTGLVDVEDPETHQIIDGQWRTDAVMEDVRKLRGNNATNAAKSQRNYLKEYFTTIGAVDWQDAMIA